jgi:hypothetical protein
MTVKLVAITVLVIAALAAVSASAQTPSPTSTPPVTTVEPFPSAEHYLRAWPGPGEDTWYVYAAGFVPRTRWALVEADCPSLPCVGYRVPLNEVFDHVKEDGTMTFYVELSRAAPGATDRLLAVVPGPVPGQGIASDAPSIRVAAHNPGGGLGYPAGTLTGIPAVDEIITLSQGLDTAAIRSRLVFKDGTTSTGVPVRGLATFQCGPYVRAEESLSGPFGFLEYPAGLVYAVFRVPDDPALPLRYEGAAYGIAWYDGGTGTPLGGLTLVSADGMVVGTEIRCGTTPGYHVHHFDDFILPPYQGPAPTPAPPAVGDSQAPRPAAPAPAVLSAGLLLLAAGAAMAASTRRWAR